MTEELKKLRADRLKQVFERFHIEPYFLKNDSDIIFDNSEKGYHRQSRSIQIKRSEFSGFLAGGYGSKGHLTNGRAQDIVKLIKEVYDVDIRLGYLLGTDLYMTDSDYLESQKKLKRILNRTTRKHLEESLKKKGMSLEDSERVIFDNGLFPVCQLSAPDLEDFERELSQYVDILTEKYILKGTR